MHAYKKTDMSYTSQIEQILEDKKKKKGEQASTDTEKHTRSQIHTDMTS